MKTNILKKNPDTGRVYLREGVRLAYFFAAPIEASVDGLRKVLELFLGFIPPNSLTWSSVGASSEEWKPMAKTTMAKVLDQLKKDAAAKRKLTSFELTDGEVGGDAPGYSIALIGEPKNLPVTVPLGLLQITFPLEILAPASLEKFVAFAKQAAGLIPFVSGYGAPALQWAELGADLAAVESKPLAIRHPGYDVQNNEATRLRLGKQARGAYWLTFLGPDLVEQLGGEATLRKQLSKAISIEAVGAGLMIRAGELPEIGDVNKKVGVPLLREVAQAIEPVTAFEDRALLSQFADFDEDYFKRWDRRLFT